MGEFQNSKFYIMRPSFKNKVLIASKTGSFALSMRSRSRKFTVLAETSTRLTLELVPHQGHYWNPILKNPSSAFLALRHSMPMSYMVWHTVDMYGAANLSNILKNQPNTGRYLARYG